MFLKFLQNVIVPEHEGVLLQVEPERVHLSYIIDIHSRKNKQSNAIFSTNHHCASLTTGSDHSKFQQWSVPGETRKLPEGRRGRNQVY